MLKYLNLIADNIVPTSGMRGRCTNAPISVIWTESEKQLVRLLLQS